MPELNRIAQLVTTDGPLGPSAVTISHYQQFDIKRTSPTAYLEYQRVIGSVSQVRFTRDRQLREWEDIEQVGYTNISDGIKLYVPFRFFYQGNIVDAYDELIEDYEQGNEIQLTMEFLGENNTPTISFSGGIHRFSENVIEEEGYEYQVFRFQQKFDPNTRQPTYEILFENLPTTGLIAGSQVRLLTENLPILPSVPSNRETPIWVSVANEDSEFSTYVIDGGRTLDSVATRSLTMTARYDLRLLDLDNQIRYGKDNNGVDLYWQIAGVNVIDGERFIEMQLSVASE